MDKKNNKEIERNLFYVSHKMYIVILELIFFISHDKANEELY